MAGQKSKYLISWNSCCGINEFEMELTVDEAELLLRVAAKADEKSCLPVLSLTELSKSNEHR